MSHSHPVEIEPSEPDRNGIRWKRYRAAPPCPLPDDECSVLTEELARYFVPEMVEGNGSAAPEGNGSAAP